MRHRRLQLMMQRQRHQLLQVGLTLLQDKILCMVNSVQLLVLFSEVAAGLSCHVMLTSS